MFARLATLLLSLFLACQSSAVLFARNLVGTIRDGRYFAPGSRFSLPVPPNAKVEDRLKSIRVSHFYARAFYPVPSVVEIPRKADWLVVSLEDRQGTRFEVHSLPLAGESFTGLPAGLHRRAAQRFLHDIALPQWFRKNARGSWVPAEMEFIRVDDVEALLTTVLMPPGTVRWARWKPEGGRYLTFGVMVFLRYDCIYMLVQSEGNYRQSRPQLVDSRRSLPDFYESLTFKPAPHSPASTAF